MSNSSSESNKNAKEEQGFTTQRLNFVLAICAILISAASFYATYLQASAAEKQVKAMTLPLLQYQTGNYDNKINKQIISFGISNAGVGPALIKKIDFRYNGKEIDDILHFFESCCEKEYKAFRAKVYPTMDKTQGGFMTSFILDTIIPPQDNIAFYQLYHGEISKEFWTKLNDTRFQLKVSICYCSLLDECFYMEENSTVKPVKFCPVD